MLGLQVNALVEHHADVDAPNINNGTTPLMTAARCGDKELLLALIAAGADRTAVNDDGESATSILQHRFGAKSIDSFLRPGDDTTRNKRRGKKSGKKKKRVRLRCARILLHVSLCGFTTWYSRVPFYAWLVARVHTRAVDSGIWRLRVDLCYHNLSPSSRPFTR